RSLRKVECIEQIVGLRVTRREWFDAPIFLDKFEHRAKVEHCVIDVPALGIWADHQRRNAETVTKFIYLRRMHMIVPAPPIGVGNHKGRAIPCLALHQRLDQRFDELLAGQNAAGWMFAWA